MKKISNYLLTASVFVMANVSAFADGEQKGVCDLLKSLESVIDTLRALAFIGAVFLLMDWAWGYIKDPSKATNAFFIASAYLYNFWQMQFHIHVAFAQSSLRHIGTDEHSVY